MERIGGRKFFVLLVILFTGVVIEIYGKGGLSANFVALALGLYGAFTASNSFLTNSALKNAPDAPPEVKDNTFPPLFNSAPAVFLDEKSQASLDRIEASLGEVVASIPVQNQALGFLTSAEQQRQSRRAGMTEITGS